ncbi:MAG: Maleylacetate reductase [Mycobacterium sp.]|jgi:maleylacetate reductase|nr:Maleylacetate reductase [Mycobacterium sp.]
MESAPSSALAPAGFTRDTMPGRIVFRDGALGDVRDELERIGAQRVMLIVAECGGHVAEQAQLAVADRLHVVWSEVRQHVPRELAERATVAATEAGIDALVTVGGGSAIGLGKAVAVSTGLPLVCVPTTYSGSEMTPIYGLTSNGEKRTARDSGALPKVVIYDPHLLVTLPSDVVGPSGMNALAHCAEALWAPNPDPITDAQALDGARRINRHLLSAYRGADVAARGQVLVASCLAGTALGTVGTSIHHALCHLLGGIFDTPHALTHAIVLPYAVKFVRPAVPGAVARLAAAMDTVSDELPTAIWSLGRSVGTPKGLRAIGITESQVEQAVEAALARGLTSPRPLTHALVHRLLEGAWRGLSPSVP